MRRILGALVALVAIALIALYAGVIEARKKQKLGRHYEGPLED